MFEAENKKLRIAMLGHKRIPSREGGIEVVVTELATRMFSKGHHVTCYNRNVHHIGGSKFDGAMPLEYKGVKLKKVWTLDTKGLAALTASFSAALGAAVGKYDIVHFHAEGPCSMLWIPKLFGKKCIATVHGLDHQRAKWGKFASWYIRRGEKCAVRFADEIIVLSENVQNYFLKTYGRSTVFIPNGVTRPDLVEPNRITDLYKLEKNKYILFLGRLVPEKGVHYLIKAYKALKTNKKLVIAGASSDTSEYERALLELADHDPDIVFTGFVQGRTLEELYSNAYVYVLPSDLEGMPLSLLEAMSYGNCCLTSDIPECAKVTGAYGLTFRKGDISDLKDRLQQLCDDTNMTEFYKKHAADYICSRYNWDDVTNRTLQLYGVNEAADPSAPLEGKAYEGAACK